LRFLLSPRQLRLQASVAKRFYQGTNRLGEAFRPGGSEIANPCRLLNSGKNSNPAHGIDRAGFHQVFLIAGQGGTRSGFALNKSED
jgi:hypothetical protein